MQARPQPLRIPGIGEFKIPISRNDLLLMLVAFTEIGTGIETVLAHLISGNIQPAEAIPAVFGPVAGIILLGAMVWRIRRGPTLFTSLIVLAVAAASISVGLIGSAFHWARVVPPANFPDAGVLSWDWIIYAPPVAGPLSFAGNGVLAIIALLEDTRPETGKLTLPGVVTFKTPLPQTRQFLWLVAFGLYAATLSAFLDHWRTDFESFFVWIPVILGVFGAVVTTVMAVYETHREADYFIFFWVMLLMMAMGVLGLGLHINADLPEGNAGLNIERFIRGAPVMAPMLFAIMGSFGLITMLGAETEEYPVSGSTIYTPATSGVSDETGTSAAGAGSA